MKRATKTIAKVFHKKRKDSFDPFSNTVPLMVMCTTSFLETNGSTHAALSLRSHSPVVVAAVAAAVVTLTLPRVLIALTVEGLFRLSGEFRVVDELMKKFEKGT